MIIPFSTDAPIYHFPKATLGMVGVNVAIHVAWSYSDPAAAEPYAMILGKGLHPLQWLTNNFLHADFFHLLFNMIFLWAYGIIVEGKIGWFFFLLTYLGIGTAYGASIQVAYLGAEVPSHVLGASAIIFGLMAISMIWAPVNEMGCFYLFFVGFRVITNVVELPIYVLALIQLGLEGVSVFFQYLMWGDPMSSALLHLSGAFWGLIAGTVVLKLGLVDCEGWDVFSMMAKRRELRARWRERESRLDRNREAEKLPRAMRAAEDRPDLSPEERAGKLRAKVHKLIEMGDTAGAQAALQKWLTTSGQPPGRDELLAVIKAFQESGEELAAVPAMRTFCKHHPQKAERVRLKLASLLVRQLERPTEARRHLDQIAEGALDATLARYRRKLLQEAEAMIEEGVLEIEEEV